MLQAIRFPKVKLDNPRHGSRETIARIKWHIKLINYLDQQFIKQRLDLRFYFFV